MESESIQIIESRLMKCNIPNFYCLPKKTQKRLIDIENYVINNEIKKDKLLDEIKKIRITKSSISECDTINISRKTIYNDDILNIYINNIIENQEDIFNLKKIELLEEKIKELSKLNNTLIDNVIEYNLLKQKLKEYEEENKLLLESFNEISNDSRNRVMLNLGDNDLKKSKVIEFKQK